MAHLINEMIYRYRLCHDKRKTVKSLRENLVDARNLAMGTSTPGGSHSKIISLDEFKRGIVEVFGEYEAQRIELYFT